jgi:hypothetical protein
VVGYPREMPLGYDVRREHGQVRARFAGYFLKLKAYDPGSAKPGQRPERTPVLIGRLEWAPPPAPPIDDSREWLWGAVLLAVLAFGSAVWFIFFKPNRRTPATLPRVVTGPSGEVIPIDVWLEQAELAADDEESAP